MEFLIQTESMNIIVETIKAFFITIYTYIISFKLLNYKIKSKKIFIKFIINVIVITIIYTILKTKINFLYSSIFLGLLISISMYTFTDYGLGYLTVSSIVALGINYVIFFTSIMISFIPNAFFNIKNRYIGLCSLVLIYSTLIFFFIRIKRIRNRYSIFLF